MYKYVKITIKLWNLWVKKPKNKCFLLKKFWQVFTENKQQISFNGQANKNMI